MYSLDNTVYLNVECVIHLFPKIVHTELYYYYVKYLLKTINLINLIKIYREPYYHIRVHCYATRRL